MLENMPVILPMSNNANRMTVITGMKQEEYLFTLMEYAMGKRGKGVADDWIAYAIVCESDPKAIAVRSCVGIYGANYARCSF